MPFVHVVVASRMITAFRSPGVGGGEGEGNRQRTAGCLFPLSLSGLFHSLFLVEDEERRRCIGFCSFPTFPLLTKETRALQHCSFLRSEDNSFDLKARGYLCFEFVFWFNVVWKLKIVGFPFVCWCVLWRILWPPFSVLIHISRPK